MSKNFYSFFLFFDGGLFFLALNVAQESCFFLFLFSFFKEFFKIVSIVRFEVVLPLIAFRLNFFKHYIHHIPFTIGSILRIFNFVIEFLNFRLKTITLFIMILLQLILLCFASVCFRHVFFYLSVVNFFLHFQFVFKNINIDTAEQKLILPVPLG